MTHRPPKFEDEAKEIGERVGDEFSFVESLECLGIAKEGALKSEGAFKKSHALGVEQPQL